MTVPLLEIKDLKVQFDTSKGVVKAVDGASLILHSGEVVGLVGESGCGKSTVAHAIVQLIQSPPGRITEGQIVFKNRDLLHLSEKQMRFEIRGHEIAMIFQDPMTYLNPVMKVGRQITESIQAHQEMKISQANERAISLLKKVNIPSPHRIASSFPHQLSGGMRQRVLIAIAISCNPSLLIADEPTTALDVTVQAQILNLIKELVVGMNNSLMLITHNLGIVAEICDRVYVIYCGQVVENGTVYQIFDTPHHPYTVGLLKSVLSIEEFKEELVTIEGAVPNMMDPPAGCSFHPRCQFCDERCKDQTPYMVDLEPGHHVRCWLFDDEAQEQHHRPYLSDASATVNPAKAQEVKNR